MKKNTFQFFQSCSRIGVAKTLQLISKEKWGGDYFTFNFGGRQFSLRKKGSDIEVFRHIFSARHYDIKKLLKRSPEVIVDLGANTGLSASYFKMTFPDAVLYAVEPDPGNFELLQSHAKQFDNVICLHHAIWSKNEMLTLYNPDTGGYSMNTIAIGNRSGEVEALTMDTLLARNGVNKVDILKMDIEGAELELFKNSDTSWLAKVGMLIIETHDRKQPGCTEWLFKAVSRYSFDVHYKGESFIIVFHH